MNRYTWYVTHDWKVPYPGDAKIFTHADVPGANDGVRSRRTCDHTAVTSVTAASTPRPGRVRLIRQTSRPPTASNPTSGGARTSVE